MRRREFIALVGGAATWPLPTFAQQSAGTAHIGYLSPGSVNDPSGRRNRDALRQGLFTFAPATSSATISRLRATLLTIDSPQEPAVFAPEQAGERPRRTETRRGLSLPGLLRFKIRALHRRTRC